MEHKEGLFISWENASAIISKQLYIILWESFVCKAELQHDDYWSTKINNRQLSVYELLKIFGNDRLRVLQPQKCVE